MLLNFDKCKFSANYVFKKLQSKKIILRSTEEGYNIKNKLRLTIGSNEENTKFTKVIKIYLINYEKYFNHRLWSTRIFFVERY